MSTSYRLQLTPDFDFAAAENVLDYLDELGITHVYLSPITEARPGSQHGYDVVAHDAVRADFGGEEGFDSLRQAVHRRGMALIIDFVPNHAGVGPGNEEWQDVLAFGSRSPHSRTFDIDWHPLKAELHGKLLLPFLGDRYGAVLERAEITLCWQRDRFFARYYDNLFALAPASYGLLLEQAAVALPALGAELRALAHDAPAIVTREAGLELRRRAAEVLKNVDLDWDSALAPLRDESRLHPLLEEQNWRLSYWKTAGSEVNYRRFFDINELIALRMEDREVFDKHHRMLAKLVRRPGVAGVRIDHVDGLTDPDDYLKRLAELIPDKKIWVEKILDRGEILPDGWPVAGTTGYEVMNDMVRQFVPATASYQLDRLYRRHVRDAGDYDDILYHCKHAVMHTTLAGELFRLAMELNRLSEADYHTRDFTLQGLRHAISEVLACFSRYRTYLPADRDHAELVIKEAIYEARRRSPAIEVSTFDFIASVLLGELKPELEDLRTRWVRRFQQYCAPVAAKGEEDTAFYRFPRLAAANEVGGHPDHLSDEPEVFHAHAKFRAMRYPDNLLATATHDHKRGEDTRMRLVALAECTDAWQRFLRSTRNAVRRHRGDHGPSDAAVYLFLQHLGALWPDTGRSELTSRLQAYMRKASREAKEGTSWINPVAEYEADVDAFVERMIGDRYVRRALGPLGEELRELGWIHSLAQVVLKLTSPGLPDIYQGCELVDLSLVDPDNRRPVDFARRRAMLAQMTLMLERGGGDVLQEWRAARDPRLKLFLSAALARLSRQHPALFAGDYEPLELPPDWLGFERRGGDQRLLVVVPRRAAAICEQRWIDLSLDPGSWRDVLSGELLAATVSTGPLGLRVLRRSGS